ncbi:MAG: DUF3347 domain-containing protein [Acidobacteria bacterium]|nr:DUF3347 domain-containing protein [Acidobacteriota bacterium]NIQ30674.1 DUF3347 domain-containing protein [Acidobacteriota bacterium]NIQ85632.1 DUF3347 domain-containing protein [Acidobacteriota bacterium]
MSSSRGLTLVVFLLAVGFSLSGSAGEASAFERIGEPYESIRQILLHDSFKGVSSEAEQIRRVLEALEKDFSAERAGIKADGADRFRELMPSLRAAASDLEAAGTIEGAREAFGELSKALVRYRQLLPESETVVVFCSMAQKVWLQTHEEIGNPYYGQSMARCGEVVSE